MTATDPQPLTYDEAIALLPDGDTIHTLTGDGAGGILGATWQRAHILDLLEQSHPQIEAAGPAAQSLNHGLAAYRADGTPVFIQTRPQPARPVIYHVTGGAP